MTIKMLDLCCGGGIAADGYMRAAFELGITLRITGVDIADHSKIYPYKFIQADALLYSKKYAKYFDFIHASPPCQEYSKSTVMFRNQGKKYPDILENLRKILLDKNDCPIVIENVPGAPIRPDIRLRGDMFGLKTLKLRWFELHNIFIMQPGIPKKTGSVIEGDYCSIFGSGSYRTNKTNAFPKFIETSVNEMWRVAMDIHRPVPTSSIAQAIPPAYTKYIGLQIFEQLIKKSNS